MPEIKDSGARRTFESGGVRDIAEGKGRCDLLPLYEVSVFLGGYLSMGPTYYPNDEVIESINQYVRNGDVGNLYTAIRKFVDREGMHPSTAILELAKHYEEGLHKYPERNWEKGLLLNCYIDSGVRHYLKHMRGDNDEPHSRAFLWNIFGAIWTHNNRPECINLPFNQSDKKPEPNKEETDYSEKLAEVERLHRQFHRETSFA